MQYEPRNWENYPSTETPITAEALNRIEQQLGAISPFVSGSVPERVQNLYDYEKSVPGSMGDTGNIFPHSANRVSDYIQATPGTPYTFYNPLGSAKIVWFDANQTSVGFFPGEYFSVETAIAPENVSYLRLHISASTGTPPEDTAAVIINRGAELFDPQESYSSGWWDDRELPPSQGTGSVDEESVRRIVETMLPQWTPSTPTLQFETIETGWYEPYWLSLDGLYIYGRSGLDLYQSDDDWDTKTLVHTFPQSIQGIRDTYDGELVVSISRDDENGIPTRVYKSRGYDPQNPTAAEWDVVLQEGGASTRINNGWGMDFYQNIGVLSEYGLRGEEGARRVWLSEDHGDTWSLVFDLKTTEAPGRPDWASDSHVHTSTWDPYWSRLWVVTGDGSSTATYYSDDKGQSWKFVEGTGRGEGHQFTGIIALPDVVLFGSDASINGVFAYRRGDKSENPIIEPILRIDDETRMTRVFQLPYKRGSDPTTPVYFSATPAGGTAAPSVIVGTVDGKKAYVIWEGEHPETEAAYSGSLRWALGPTAKGNIVAIMGGDPTITGTRVMRCEAPTWNRI